MFWNKAKDSISPNSKEQLNLVQISSMFEENEQTDWRRDGEDGRDTVLSLIVHMKTFSKNSLWLVKQL